MVVILKEKNSGKIPPKDFKGPYEKHHTKNLLSPKNLYF